MSLDKLLYHINNIKIFFTTFFIIFWFFQAKCNNNNLVHAIDTNYFGNLYNFQFTSATNSFNNNIPNNILYLWRMYYHWWMLLSTNEKTYLSQCFSNIVLYYEGNNSSQDSLKIYFEAFRLRLLLFNHQYIKAYQLVNNLIDTLRIYPYQSLKKDDQKLIMGLLHYLGASAYKKYSFLFRNKSLSHLSDTLGINLLKQCTKSSSVFVRTEGLYFLMKIYLEIEGNFSKAYIYSSQLISLFPGNIIFGYHHLVVLNYLKKYHEVEMYKAKLIAELSRNKELTNSQKDYLKRLINIKI